MSSDGFMSNYKENSSKRKKKKGQIIGKRFQIHMSIYITHTLNTAKWVNIKLTHIYIYKSLICETHLYKYKYTWGWFS